MEKYVTQTLNVGTNTVSLYSWRFTPEERDHLKRALAKKPEDRVTLFINGLEEICAAAKSFLRQRNVSFQRAERRRMIGRLEKAETDLYRLLDRHQDPRQDVRIRERTFLLDGHDDESALEASRLHRLMLSASMQIREIINILDEGNHRPGRPSADEATGELVTIIAAGFAGHFGKPPAYRRGDKSRPGSGAFYAVVQICLQACGLRSECPERHIRAALKQIKAPSPAEKLSKKN